MTQREVLWNIGHCEREYARETGDPVIGQVVATTREQAIERARRNEWIKSPGIIFAPTGYWAWSAEETQRNALQSHSE